jgi:hypothetical protein
VTRGFAILACTFLLVGRWTQDVSSAILATCFVLAVLPPRLDPAIQIKERLL